MNQSFTINCIRIECWRHVSSNNSKSSAHCKSWFALNATQGWKSTHAKIKVITGKQLRSMKRNPFMTKKTPFHLCIQTSNRQVNNPFSKRLAEYFIDVKWKWKKLKIKMRIFFRAGWRVLSPVSLISSLRGVSNLSKTIFQNANKWSCSVYWGPAPFLRSVN